MSKTPLEFDDAGCELAKSPLIFLGLHKVTRGDPCTTGCAYFNSGKCPAYLKLFKPQQAKLVVQQGETVREEAARLGISISEVRRRRKS